MRILVVDNHDSFVFNIVQYLLELGADCDVRDRSGVDLGDAAGAAGILLSPGPGHPADTGICLDLVREADRRSIPLLGVCLGHQVIATAYGGTVSRAPEVVHGYTSPIQHTGLGILAGLSNPFPATRYHSLAVRPDTVPPELEITARTPDGVIMGLRHRTRPIEGVQFHPESVLSEGGHHLLQNWLAGCSPSPATRTREPAPPFATSANARTRAAQEPGLATPGAAIDRTTQTGRSVESEKIGGSQ